MLAAIAEHCPPSSLSPDERVRNTFGRGFCYTYDPSRTDTVVSTLPGVFPDVHLCPVREDVWVEPAMPVLRGASGATDTNIVVCEESFARCDSLYSARPIAGCRVPAPGFATLHSLPFTPVLEKIGVNIFGFASKKDSIIVAVGHGRRRDEMYGLTGAAWDDDDVDPFLANAGAAAAFMSGGPGDTPVPPHHGHHHEHHGGGSRRSSEVNATAVSHSRDASSAAALTPAHHAEFGSAGLYGPGTTLHAGPTFALSESGPSSVTGGNASRRLTAQAYASLLGQVVYVEYPHLREALVVGVSDAIESIRGSSATTMARTPHSADEAVGWAKAARGLDTDLRTGKAKLSLAGIHVGRIDVVIHVRKLIGMRRDPANGSLARVWASGPSHELRVREKRRQRNSCVR